ncbi:ATP-binding protein [Sporomusa sp. KB1]|jgi:predicted kinase|uniref:ATP-binding protein n=1 Tax=Sporomusa sp. KB1 TaxID=943346 RepID=UPI0011A2F733|nr:ATP-binding protein [Sporomusa sp. KB1]TWH46343.1 putative kinase [Sporomusa sp. KB1]
MIDLDLISPLRSGDLIITVGLPLSGKSTLVKNCSEYMPNVVVVCPDTIRLALHGNQFIGRAEPFVWAIAQTMARTFLMQGNTVIIDATNTTVERRKMWVYMAREFKKGLTIYHVKTPADVCRERNKALGRLDESIIDRMEEQFERPLADEGYVFTAAQVESYLYTPSYPFREATLPSPNL